MKNVKSNTKLAELIKKGDMDAFATICYKLHLYIDHYHIFYADGFRSRYVNSFTIGKDGMSYTLAKFE